MWEWFSEMTEDWQLKSKPPCAVGSAELWLPNSEPGHTSVAMPGFKSGKEFCDNHTLCVLKLETRKD